MILFVHTIIAFITTVCLRGSKSRKIFILFHESSPTWERPSMRHKGYVEQVKTDCIALGVIIEHTVSVCTSHRVSTAREEKRVGGQRFFCQIEPNWPLPHSTVPVPQLREAMPAGWVTYCSICASTMPRAQGRKRFNCIVKTIHFSYLPIIYLWGTLKKLFF